MAVNFRETFLATALTTIKHYDVESEENVKV